MLQKQLAAQRPSSPLWKTKRLSNTASWSHVQHLTIIPECGSALQPNTAIIGPHFAKCWPTPPDLRGHECPRRPERPDLRALDDVVRVVEEKRAGEAVEVHDHPCGNHQQREEAEPLRFPAVMVTEETGWFAGGPAGFGGPSHSIASQRKSTRLRSRHCPQRASSPIIRLSRSEGRPTTGPTRQPTSVQVGHPPSRPADSSPGGCCDDSEAFLS